MQDGAGGEGGIHLLLSILADGEEQARQLGELPDDPRSRAEHDYRGAARRLQCTLGKAVSVAKAMEAASGSSRGTDHSDSPRSVDESSGGTTAMETQERQGVCKRRKGLPRWTAKFRVPDANLEATPEDGFSWRKYGQKDILGAKFPRGYYRCTYRASQGCPATKQVQRSDTDLCVFDVTYQGAHTCHQKQRHHATPSSPAEHSGGSLPAATQDPSMQLLASFNDCLKVEATAEAAPLYTGHDQDRGAASAPPAGSAFSFLDTQFHAGVALGDPAAASYFYDYELPAARMPGAGSELAEVVSKATSAAGFDYSMYHHGEFDPHLPFATFGGPYQ